MKEIRCISKIHTLKGSEATHGHFVLIELNATILPSSTTYGKKETRCT